MTDTPNPVVKMVEKATKPKVELADARPPEFSDDALAQRFVERHGDKLRYVAMWRHWYAWTGAQWKQDTTLNAFDRARAICRAASSDADTPHIKTGLASSKTVASVERLAKVDQRTAATVEQWDADPDTFNTEATPPGQDGGTIGETKT